MISSLVSHISHHQWRLKLLTWTMLKFLTVFLYVTPWWPASYRDNVINVHGMLQLTCHDRQGCLYITAYHMSWAAAFNKPWAKTIWLWFIAHQVASMCISGCGYGCAPTRARQLGAVPMPPPLLQASGSPVAAQAQLLVSGELLELCNWKLGPCCHCFSPPHPPKAPILSASAQLPTG